MSYLESIDLSHNQLHGTLPALWLQAPYSYFQMLRINLADNMLTGGIPAGMQVHVHLLHCVCIHKCTCVCCRHLSSCCSCCPMHIEIERELHVDPMHMLQCIYFSTLCCPFYILSSHATVSASPRLPIQRWPLRYFCAEWMGSPSPLRSLILSNNPGISSNVSALKLPANLQALQIANTNISGSFIAGWMGLQSPELSCLVAYGTSGLCGALDGSLPCSLVNFTQGTKLGK